MWAKIPQLAFMIEHPFQWPSLAETEGVVVVDSTGSSARTAAGASASLKVEETRPEYRGTGK